MEIKYFYVGHGINKYPNMDGSNLSQCVGDVKKLSRVLRTAGYTCFPYYDEECTKELIVKHWKDTLELAKQAEKAVVVIHQSSHGTQVPDTSGDEEDGMDEALVCYDTKWESGGWKNVVIDDEIGDILKDIDINKTIVVLISDTCHSGTVTKRISRASAVELIKSRKFLYPRNYLVVPEKAKTTMDEYKTGFIENNLNHILLAGSSPNKYSFESSDGGVLTTAIVDTVSNNLPYMANRLTLIQNAIRNVRNGGYDQYPHYECSKRFMELLEFCFDKEKEKPQTPIGETPEPVKKKSFWSAIASFFKLFFGKN